MANKLRFSFHDRELPYLPIELTYQNRSLKLEALIDSGSTVNVLPYNVGEALGVTWETQNSVLQLAGNLASIESRALLLNATIQGLPTVRLAFAWAQTSDVPLILGHTNFFIEFDVCFTVPIVLLKSAFTTVGLKLLLASKRRSKVRGEGRSKG